MSNTQNTQEPAQTTQQPTPIIINNCVGNESKAKKLPWVARWSGIIILSLVTGGFYMIPGLIIRSICKNK